MKSIPKFIVLCLAFFTVGIVEAQEYLRFEDYRPLRELKCGLWINTNGDIAYKDQAMPPPNEMGEDVDGVSDYYIYKAYNGLDSINEYETQLRNIVDTMTFQFLGECYFKDKNRVYMLNPMAYGGYLVVNNDADIKTFRAMEEDPSYACDKNECYWMSRQIEGADPATFTAKRIQFYPTAQDKNHYYIWNERRTKEEFKNFLEELK